MPGKPRRAPHFLPQYFRTRSPTAPIWNINYDKESFLEGNIIATAEWLVFYEDLSHISMDITH
jgi:hypothetical protein